MGLLDRLLGKKEKEDEKPPRELSLGELDSWVKRRIEELQRGVVKNLANEVEEIKRAREDAEEIVRDLAEYEFPPDIKKKVFKPVLTSKPAYVKAMLEALKGIGANNPESFDEVEDFYITTRKTMKTIEKIQLGKGRYLMVTFREDMLKIGGALNTILDSLKNMEEELKETREKVASLKGILRKVKELRKRLRIHDGKSAEKREVERLRKRKKELEERYERLIAGEEYREYKWLEKKLAELEDRKSSLRMRVINIIGPFRRSFRKLRKLMEDNRIAYADLNTLDRYLNNPFEAFEREDRDCSRIKALLSALSSAIQEGVLKLRRREREKVALKIESEAGSLEELRRELHHLEREMAEVEARISKFRVLEDKKSIEREINAVDERLKHVLKELESAEEEQERLREEIPEVLAELQSDVERLTGEKVLLKISSP